MELLKLPHNIYEYYKREVRGAENESYEQARRKLTRNAELSKAIQTNNGDGLYCMYGKLHFIVADSGMIIWMKNNCKTPKGWKRDNKLYLELNKKLGIDNNINMMGLNVRDTFIQKRRKFNGIKWKVKNEIVISDLMAREEES